MKWRCSKSIGKWAPRPLDVNETKAREIGGQTLTVPPGTSGTIGAAAITTGNVTLTGNAVVAVNDLQARHSRCERPLGGGIGQIYSPTEDRGFGA